jgi:hypothetical protein
LSKYAGTNDAKKLFIKANSSASWDFGNACSILIETVSKFNASGNLSLNEVNKKLFDLKFDLFWERELELEVNENFVPCKSPEF